MRRVFVLPPDHTANTSDNRGIAYFSTAKGTSDKNISF